ncbi:MAG: hypothetical protein NTW14_09185 [bacterium]|nr:hypothetical protein [bacterium]
MKEKTVKKRTHKEAAVNIFGKENYIFFLGAIGVIFLGYIAMMQGPWNSFWSLRLAPMLLVLGYCVLVPWAIIRRSRNQKGD